MLVYQAFLTLSGQRTGSGFGINPIQVSEMLAYNKAFKLCHDTDFIEFMSLLDVEYRNYTYKEQEKKQEQSKKNSARKLKTR